jgi:hypothetical protein
MIRVALVLLFILNVTTPVPAKNARLSLYRNARLGIEFKYPSGWAPEPCRGAFKAPDCVGFKPKRRRADQDYLLMVSVPGKGLEEAVREDGRFQQSGGRWEMTGRLGAVDEEREVKGRGWEGLFGSAVCGISVDGAFHGAGGECCGAFLHRQGRTVKVESDGRIPPDTVLSVVKSFKFLN